mgnify:CR=1 FL=1
MRIAVAGSSGLIGNALVNSLRAVLIVGIAAGMAASVGSSYRTLTDGTNRVVRELMTGKDSEGSYADIDKAWESADGERQTDLIILTHDTKEGSMNQALAAMQALPTVLAPIVRLRKEELA